MFLYSTLKFWYCFMQVAMNINGKEKIPICREKEIKIKLVR